MMSVYDSSAVNDRYGVHNEIEGLAFVHHHDIRMCCTRNSLKQIDQYEYRLV
jgi:hypothetical protein